MTRSARFARIAPAVVAAALFAQSLPARAAGGDTTQTTEQLANEAYDQVAAGKFSDAIATYLKAYEISKEPTILLNIATIYDHKLKERALAAEFYRRYSVQPGAEPERVKKVAERLSAIKKEEDAEAAARMARPAPAPEQPKPTPAPAPAPAPPPPAAEPSESGGSGMRTAGLVIGVVGVAAVGGSMVLGLVAKGKNDDANAVCNGTACADDHGVSLAKSAGNFATASTVTFISGLVLVGVGVTLFVASPKSSSSSSQSAYLAVSPGFAPGGGGLTLHGGF